MTTIDWVSPITSAYASWMYLLEMFVIITTVGVLLALGIWAALMIVDNWKR